MKKKLIVLFVSCLFFVQTGFNQTFECKADTVYEYVYVTGTNVTLPFRRTINQYNSESQLNNRYFQNWDNGSNSYVNQTWNTYTYDTNGNLTVHLILNWAANSWVNNFRITRTYNSDNLVLESLSQSWDSPLNDWTNSGRSFSVYDQQGNQTQLLLQSWVSSSWVNNQVNDYEFDAQGNLTSRTIKSWSSSLNNWENQERYFWTYNGNQQQSEFLVQEWNAGASIWLNDNRTENIYDSANLLTQELYANWNQANNTWEQSGKSDFTYTPANKINEQITQIWLSGSSTWQNQSRQTYEYSTLDVLIARNQFSNWNVSTEVYDYGTRMEYRCSFIDVTDLESFVLTDDVALFPNPVMQGQWFNVQSEKSTAYTLRDFLGKTYMQGNLQEGNNVLETHTLVSGIYFLQAGNKIIKFIIK